MFFGGVQGVLKRLDGFLIDQQNAKFAAHRRPLGEQDVTSFFEAAEQRPRQVNDAELLGILRYKSGYRMWRLAHDMKWLRQELIKMGIDPERARNLL